MRRRLSPEYAGNYMVNVRKYQTFIMLLYSTSFCACVGAYLPRMQQLHGECGQISNISYVALFNILMRMRRRLSFEDAGNYCTWLMCGNIKHLLCCFIQHPFAHAQAPISRGCGELHGQRAQI
jgi:hypothetical protein